MPDIEITRKQIIVVKDISQNSYGDLIFTDKEGKEYKVGAKRRQYFDEIIQPGVAVQLNYSKFKGREYIYNANPVNEEIEKLPKPTLKAPEPKSSPVKEEKGSKPLTKDEQMTKDDWAEKDRTTRKSIERQKSLEMAVEVAKIKASDSAEKIIATAKLFEAYLEGIKLGGDVAKKDRVVEEAMKLGKIEE